MKRDTFETKRRKARKNPVYRFRANARRRKQRVAATASDTELDSHVPNLNVGRALVVITLLHVVAIAGIIVHNKWFDGTHQPVASNHSNDAVVAPIEKERANAPAPALENDYLDKPVEDIAILSHYLVQTGDNYARIAVDHGVNENDLRRVNKNLPLRAGRILRIPAARLVAQETEEMRRLRANERFQKLNPPEPKVSEPVVIESTPPRPQAVLIKPKRKPFGVGAPRAQVVKEDSVDSGQRYTVQAGDTVWRISQRFGVKQGALLEINGLDDPRKLTAGRELKIPQ